jgi:putative ATP-binding cassette transporter
MRLFSFLVKHSPGVLVLAVITGIVSGSASAALMALINRALSGLAHPPNSLAVAFAGVTLTVLLSNLISRLLLLRLSTRAVLQMRINLCEQILVSPLREIEDHGLPRLMAALTEDVLAVSDTLADFPLLCINGAVLLACFSYLIWLRWPLGLAFVAFFAFGTLTYELIEWRTRALLRQGRETWDRLVTIYEALILGNKELKLHYQRRQAFFAEELRPAVEKMKEISFGWHSRFAIAAGYGQIYYFLVIGVILFVAPRIGSFDASVLTAFTLLTLYINGPLSFIIGTFPVFQRADVSLEKIESLGLSLSSGSSSDVNTGAMSLPDQSFSGIEVVGLTYVYHRDDDDKAFTLGPVDLKINPGQLTFVIGGNGSGKSSFARLLTGLYVPESGFVLFNGQPVTNENRDHYRQNFSVVFSDYYLFESLLGLMTDDLSERVGYYLDKLRLTSKVKVVQGRFSTTNLSQGQRKRLALLTAFIEDRHIYLFDEWAADQDPTFKEVFYHQILPDLKVAGKTVLIISHDEHYYHVADRIIKFEDGLVIEDRLQSHSSSGDDLASGEGVYDGMDERMAEKGLA